MAKTTFFVDTSKNWGKNEKSEFIKFCRNSLQGIQSTSPILQGQCKDLKKILFNACQAAVQGFIAIEMIVSALAEIVHLHNDLPSIIADVLIVLDSDSQCTDNRDERERFLLLLKGCNKKIVPECILKERLDFETTGDAGIIKAFKSTQTKFIKIKTRLFYKQQKFNLFREESEGYGKLITELNQAIGSKLNHVYVLEVIKSLIGCFNLDPNRVLDVILESFECRLELIDFFIPLLSSFSCTSATLSQVLGFKFGFYQQNSTTEMPLSLFKVTALLLKAKLVTLNQLYGLLKPDDSRIIEKHKQELTEAQVYARRINVVSMAAEKSEENKDQIKEDDTQFEEVNQKLGLCAALLDVGDWEHAQQLMACMPEFYAVSHSHIAQKLCNLIHVIIDPLYRRHGLSLQVKKKTTWQLEFGIFPSEVQNFPELIKSVFPMVLALGPHLYLDPVLMVKIIRLAKVWLSEKSNLEENGALEIINVLEESLLPALSLLECNCCMAEELWSLLKLFPYRFRYVLYTHWKSTAHLTHPLLIRTKAETLKKLRYIMKRLSKENVKPSGRQIGKLSHSNPGYLFDYILSQIQTWDNLITPVVDSLKYLTSLSYDVLACSIIEALANPEKERMKHDGTSISMWLQSLASFGGAIFKKYSIELTGLLQYVTNQLKSEKSLDLLILKEIVTKMTGIEASEEMTNEQIDAMSGGELLKAEGGYFNQLRNTKKSSQRLKDALLENDLALPLCLLMAQHRQCILHHEQYQSHLKLVGKLYDQCQDTLVQFGSFLASSLSVDDYVHRLPPLSELLTQYFIQADVAFFLIRPMFNYTINFKFEEMKKLDKNIKAMSSAQKLQKYVEAVEAVNGPIIQSIKPLQAPKSTWEDLSPQFYITFWSLTMYDLQVPVASYEREICKLKSQVLQPDDNKDVSKKKKERERCDTLIAKLMDEEKRQQEHCARVVARLKNEKDTWFSTKLAKSDTITQFLQLCVFPRCIFTAVDAVYCAKFVHLIHALKTPNFSTLLCYDRIFCDITYTVTMCTENEANRYGRCLCAMLETVMRWHSDKAIFEKECANFPGFMTKFRVATQSSDSSTDHVDYENYRHVCHKWHFKITRALLISLDSGDYVQIRNSLIILIKILQWFPIVSNLSQALERRIDKIRSEEKDKRPDIYALATGYAGQLKSKKPNLIPESQFHVKETKDAHRNSSGSISVKADVVKSENSLKEVGDASEKLASEFASKERDLKFEGRGDGQRLSSSKINSVSKQNITGQVNSQVTGKTSSTKYTHRDEQNGPSESSDRTKPERHREEKSSSTNSNSPMRRDEKSSNKSDSCEKPTSKEEKKDRRDEYYDKQERRSGEKDVDYCKEATDQSLYSHRRVNETTDGDREHKRRRTENSSSTKSPRTDERTRDGGDKDVRSAEKPKESERNSNNRDQQPEVVYVPSSKANLDKEKSKNKEKKANRKRDHPDENSQELKRRKEEDSGKRNGQKEERELRHRRDTSFEVDTLTLYDRSRERRLEARDDKKHHRSSSATATSKKRT